MWAELAQPELPQHGRNWHSWNCRNVGGTGTAGTAETWAELARLGWRTCLNLGGTDKLIEHLTMAALALFGHLRFAAPRVAQAILVPQGRSTSAQGPTSLNAQGHCPRPSLYAPKCMRNYFNILICMVAVACLDMCTLTPYWWQVVCEYT